VERHLAAIGLPTEPAAVAGRVWDIERLIDHMHRDKKVQGGRITFVLARGIGQAFVARDVDLKEVSGLLEEALAA
jgi:3-dehydroquinate synthetase